MAGCKYNFDNSRRFVNTYNFIPVKVGNLPKYAEKKQSTETLHTGVLECRLITKSPIAIPDSESVEVERVDKKDENGNVVTGKNGNIIKEEHKKYKFFRNGKHPSIPGSTVRGLIRSVYETITDSCFSTTKEEDTFTVRNVRPNLPEAGLLCYDSLSGKWKLYAAKKYKTIMKCDKYGQQVWINTAGEVEKYVSTRTKYKDGDMQGKYQDGKVMANGSEYKVFKRMRENEDVYFNGKRDIHKISKTVKKTITAEEKAVYTQGYMMWGENNNKGFGNVFVKDNKEVSTDNVNEIIKKLDIIYRDYNDKSINNKLKSEKNWYMGYTEAKKTGVIPVWYEKEAGKLYVSLASKGRMCYEKTWVEMVDNKRPCNADDVCQACNLFGTIRTKSSYSGRVRITDAICNNSDIATTEVTLKELSSPKPSYELFYMDGKNIRGRKYYWHNAGAVGKDVNYIKENRNICDNNKSGRNTTVELVDSEVEFLFKVYFDGITDVELKQLMWTITLGENTKESVFCHKVGHGRPLGLGSAKIVIDKKVERKTQLNGEEFSYDVKESEDVKIEEWEDMDEDIIKSLKYISNIKATEGKKVCYPYVIDKRQNKSGGINELAAHQWFSQNKNGGKMGKQRDDAMKLPKITDGDITLETLVCKKEKSENTNGRRR